MKTALRAWTWLIPALAAAGCGAEPTATVQSPPLTIAPPASASAPASTTPPYSAPSAAAPPK